MTRSLSREDRSTIEDANRSKNVYLLGYFGKITEPSVKLIDQENRSQNKISNNRYNACVTSELTDVTNEKLRCAQFCMCDCDCDCDPGPA